jgi:hypothetical protein
MNRTEGVQHNRTEIKTSGLHFVLKTLKLKSRMCFHNVVIAGHPTVKQLCALSDDIYISKSGRNKPSNADFPRRKAAEQFRWYLLGKKEVCIIPAAAGAAKRRLHLLCNFYTKLKQATGTQFRTLNFQLSTKILFQNKLQE